MSDLARELSEQLARIGPPLRGRFIPLEAAAEHELQRASAYLDRAHLEAQMFRAVPEPDRAVVDRRSVASRFMRDYCGGVVPPVVVALALGIGIDASLARARSVWERVTVREVTLTVPHALSVPNDAFSACAECRPTYRGPVPVIPTHEEIRAQVWRSLFADHLAPLVDVLLDVVKLSPRVLWASAAEMVGRVAHFGVGKLGSEAARPFVDECEALLAVDALPGISGPNPLKGQIHWQDIGRAELPRGLMLRSVCCTVFKLPDRKGQVYCGTCPLPPLETLLAINAVGYGRGRDARAATEPRSALGGGPPDATRHP